MTEIGEVGVRKRRSCQETKRLVREFETSGLRRSEFCHKHNWALGTLQRGLRRRRAKPSFALSCMPSSICYEQAANGVCFLESFHRGTRSTTTFGPGRTMVSGLVSSAQCTSKYDGKPD